MSSSTQTPQTPPKLAVTLTNNTSSSSVFAYVTGHDIDRNNAVFLLQSDGVTGLYPASPAVDGSRIAANCHIALGAPGTSRDVTIPHLAGARIWFCVGGQLTFLLNKGPSLVEPSVTNPADPNYNLQWDFCEFTYNKTELFANITYVDFVGVPMALTLTTKSGATQTVKGLRSGGLNAVCSMLAAQTAADGAGWSRLVIKDKAGNNLRALSPNNGIIMNKSLFSGYYQAYVDQVWSKYASSALKVNTQAAWGVLDGRVSNNELGFGGAGVFAKPSAADIFSCSTGPFASAGPNENEMGNIAARLAAAFNRSTLLTNANQPADEVPTNYYRHPVTNHYARIVHAVSIDGKGYAFPFDDVAAGERYDVAGIVTAPDPAKFVVTIGGPAGLAYRDPASSGGAYSQLVGGQRLGRRDTSASWLVVDPQATSESGHWPSAEEEKTALFLAAASADSDSDFVPVKLEGSHGHDSPGTLRAQLVSATQAVLARYAQPALEAAARGLAGLLPLSMRAAASRALAMAALMMGSFYLGLRRWEGADGLA